MTTVQQRRTLGEMRSLLRNRLAIAETDTFLTASVLDEFINAALQQVSVEHNWPWLLTTQSISTVSGTATYDVEEDWLASDTIAITADGTVLVSRGKKDILGVPTTTTGRPVHFGVWAEQIVLRPVPDAVYTLTHYYFRLEPVVAGDLAKPLIPKVYDEGVLEYATYLGWRFKDQDQRAALALNAYERWLKRTADNLVESKEPRAPRTRRGGAL